MNRYFGIFALVLTVIVGVNGCTGGDSGVQDQEQREVTDTGQMIRCDGELIDPNTNPMYCGASGDNCEEKGSVCEPGTSCQYGTCKKGCIVGQVLCDGKCIIPKSDNIYCGASGDNCEDRGEACGHGTSCQSGKCEQGCVSGQVLCDGKCITPETDNMYCGASGDCTGANKGEACGDGSSCQDGTCKQGCVQGQILCNGQCITPGTSNLYCGARGNCTGDDKEADDYQGEACSDGTSCKQGTCQQGCIAGQVLCNGQCITPGEDNTYCGAKGNCTGDNKEAEDYQGEACSDGTSCKGGVCKQGCIAGQILCNGQCITPGTSNLYCGAKGKCTGDDKEAEDYQGESCSDGTSCKGGTCQQGCVAGQVLCDGQCIVPGTDNQYCGASGDLQGTKKVRHAAMAPHVRVVHASKDALRGRYSVMDNVSRQVQAIYIVAQKENVQAMIKMLRIIRVKHVVMEPHVRAEHANRDVLPDKCSVMENALFQEPIISTVVRLVIVQVIIKGRHVMTAPHAKAVYVSKGV